MYVCVCVCVCVCVYNIRKVPSSQRPSFYQGLKKITHEHGGTARRPCGETKRDLQQRDKRDLQHRDKRDQPKET